MDVPNGEGRFTWNVRIILYDFKSQFFNGFNNRIELYIAFFGSFFGRLADGCLHVRLFRNNLFDFESLFPLDDNRSVSIGHL